MVNYLLHRMSILRHFSLQHFTSVVISLDIYLTLCACQDTLDKSHCYFVCLHTPEWKEKVVLFSTSSSYFYWYKQQRSKSVYHWTFSESKRIRFQRTGVYSVGRLQYMHTVCHSDQTVAAYEWLFLPSQSHCDRFPLVRPLVCLLSV